MSETSETDANLDPSLAAREALRFRTLIENLTETVVIVDAAGTLLYASPSVEALAGVPAGEAVGSNVFDFIFEEDRAEAMASLGMVAQGTHPPGPIRFRIPRAAAEGSPRSVATRMVEASGENLLDHPAVAGIVISFRDVTDRVLLEDQLRGAQKMEAVGRLAGGIAHDFNNILTALAGNVEMILEDLSPDHPVRNDVEELQAGVRRAAGLTSRLLGFSRRQIMIFRTAELAEVVQGMEGLLRRVLESHIELRLDPMDAGRVRVDLNQLEQVILNLVINARDAMPRGGVLRLGVTRVTLGAADDARHPFVVKPGPYLLLEVEDTGEGMTQDTLGRLFEPFFTTKPPGRGTGLGLAMAYGFVKQSLGYIWVDSAPGAGTTFRIHLPEVPGPEDPARSGPTLGSDNGA